jgi:L-threonylcarbamoyladenylate synthase
MRTRRIEVTRDLPEWDAISAAAATIQRGGIVAFPTDTTYGFAAGIFCEQAITRLRRLKARGRGKPFVVIAADADWVRELAAQVTPVHLRLMETYWPGPLTIVFRASAAVPRFVLGAASTIAVRIPDDTLTQSILRASGTPLVAPSANLKGAVPATEAGQVLAAFGGKIELVLDGGPSESSLPSTIVAVKRRRFEVLREGRLILGDSLS